MKNIIDKYVGMEYEHRGGEGTVDCLSLVVSFLNDCGLYLPEDDGREIKKNWHEKDPKRFVRELSKYADEIHIDNIQPLDVVIFKLEGIPKHAGVMISGNKFIHAREGRKVSVTRLKHYKKYLHSCWRVRCDNE